MGYIENGIVAMFDILGFSSLIENEEMKDIVGYINNGFEQVIESNAWGTKEVGTFHYINSDKEGSVIEPDIDNLIVNYRYYSDTLMYFTEDVSEESFYKMMVISAKVMAQMYFYVGLPIRGAVSCGELYFSDKNIFGKSIIDAYRYEQNQEWAGVMLSKKLIEECNDFKIFKSMQEDNLLLEYEIPVKDKNLNSNQTLNWMQYNGELWDIDRFEEQWYKLRKSKYMSNSAKQKLENTIKFRHDTLNNKIKNKRQYNFGMQIMI